MSIALSSRRNGKTARTIAAIREAAARGEHVHLAASHGLRCVAGPGDCPAVHCTLDQAERALRRAR
jgi:hypothetical protein